ncbi:AfsR/SARP family transcriptional regulator [Haloactinomyces albus]|uniref:DNA-binding SARP family transcriptional activator/tetratricopeptide (TPR) repeat protein n=1 Tax=Haloactinomyces albus TaxID=1352928 RepID=A0AAE3ZD03_9ACTN|nr:BTAD domain-containing putative transcriptional regulator [Haloactinomyces albus]MDR7301580.1 DNA-binding SARP family transcriptional activator/tetratricopeptide (TPR) repeat protein [Haloactinomyces albus]
MSPQDSSTGAPGTGFEFRVLGPLEVLHGGVLQPLGNPGMRSVLACLLFEPNQVVSMERIITTLWGEAPPATARTIVHGYISKLRKMLAAVPDTAGDEEAPTILTRAPGYVLTVDSDRIDAHRARALINHAYGLDPAERSRVLSEALTLWRGPVLSDISSSRLHRMVAANLDELRLLALEERIAAGLELGHHQYLVAELSGLVDEYPLRERLTGQLMLANYRSGQRADAQARYHALRERLSDELGIDPGPELRSLYEQLLRDDETLLGGDRGSAATVPADGGSARPVPAELPPAVAGFVGRDRELAALDRILADREQGMGNLLAVLTGPAGVGKSALAVTWAHRVAHTFTDGRLHASLRGFDSERAPLSPGEALIGFLKALGVAADAIPVDLDGRAALYRSLLADRRVLVLLDDARDSDQVRPLLPGSPGSLVVVTSRRRLDELVVRSGARMLPLETLPTPAAVELLDRAGVPGRSASEPVAARRLADLCGGLPLALRIAAARLAANPGRGVADLVDELTDERNRLHGLDIDGSDASVRRAFDISYRNLHPAHATMFRLLGTVPGHTFTAHTVAALCGTDPPTARRRLRALVLAHLVTEPDSDRFGMHDLLRLYARDLLAAGAEETAGSGADCARAALRRLLHHYLVVADHARRFLRPARDELDFSGDDTTVRPAITGRAEALEWFDAEWPNLVAAIGTANAEELHEYAWPLVRLQFNYLMVRCPWEDWIAIYNTGLDSARKLDDPAGKVLMSAGLGVVHSRSGSPAVALEYYAESYADAVNTGESSWLAMAQVNLGSALFRLGRYDEAQRHCEEALNAYRMLGDRYREAGALNNLAQVEQVSGDREAALVHLRAAEAMYREADDLETLAMVLNNCGEVSVEMGHVTEAERYHQEALDVAQRCGSAMRQAAAYLGLGDAADLRRNRPVARTRWETALSIFEAGGSPRAGEARNRLHGWSRAHRNL